MPTQTTSLLEKSGSHLLDRPQCPVDARIQRFLDEYLNDVRPAGAPRLPSKTLILDRPGLGRTLSLPPSADRFQSPYLTSYRVAQGILHNPKSDRRTTQGVFHVVEGGFPVPEDKLAVPKQAFARLLEAALSPPADALTLPFTADQAEPARLFVSLLLRPLVCPKTAEAPAKTMEVRFFAPGSLVSNLDFVEGIFGNAGDPFLLENDAALDAFGWTGHSGCVILAPHMVGLRKKDLGLPHIDQATARQQREGMCFSDEAELYNGGRAFKVACRDQRGVMVTLIADNYYGYCKKEVKAQISFAANLYGLCEEEHSGGAIAYPSYILGQDFNGLRSFALENTSFERAMQLLGERVAVKPERYALDARYPNIYYVPEDAAFSLRDGLVKWAYAGAHHELVLRPGSTYILPSGYKVQLEKQSGGTAWRLVGTRADGVLCHKPCTVSGGGKSEISKSLRPLLQPAPVFVKDYEHDMNEVERIVNRDYVTIYKQPPSDGRASRPLLSVERSLGSVIKLLTPSDDYTDGYNAWLVALPQTIRQLVFVLKRYYRPEWRSEWKAHFTVDRINGYAGHQLKLDNQLLMASHMRVGFEPGTSSFRLYKLRPDFSPADKVQVEDDITASVILPRERVPGLDPHYANGSVKVVENCEALLFQRPDDAIHRGFDQQAELDLATPDTFISNFEPLTRDRARALVDHVTEFDRFSQPMQDLLRSFVAASEPEYVVCSDQARLVDGKPSKNPRYLQRRPDRVNQRATHIAEVGERLHAELPAQKPLFATVHAVLAGRRTSRPQPEIGLPPLAVFNPIHYQELPELFMDFMSSLTGKSPSTTGFGSEGALTKGPFNALWPVVDMNNALLSAILTGYAGFTSAAGYIGPNFRVDHDVSMLVPEIWCRMRVSERDPRYLREQGYLEKLEDFELNGRTVLASRLGYRITERFVDHFLGRIFETPSQVFGEDMLKPERQGLEPFAAGIEAIVETQVRVAQSYFSDGSVEAACPPLKALLHVMVHGHYDGMPLSHARIRALFDREETLKSSWYAERLRTKQTRELTLWQRHAHALDPGGTSAAAQLPDLAERRAAVARELVRVASPRYLEELVGTLGADPFHLQLQR
jgi:hypothetical protein